jgi:hypothetical protein
MKVRRQDAGVTHGPETVRTRRSNKGGQPEMPVLLLGFLGAAAGSL